jgi:hypothetical protein
MHGCIARMLVCASGIRSPAYYAHAHKLGGATTLGFYIRSLHSRAHGLSPAQFKANCGADYAAGLPEHYSRPASCLPVASLQI